MNALTRQVARLLAIVTVAGPLCAQAPPVWHLQLDHAIRPAEGTPGMIGNVADLALARSGVVYVAEQEPARVVRYDTHGGFGGVVMASGNGPGEARYPRLTMVGDTLAVFDDGLDRLTRIGPDNARLSERSVFVNNHTTAVSTSAGGMIYVNGLTESALDGRAAIRIAPTGRLDTLTWRDDPATEQSFVWYAGGTDIIGAPFMAAGHGAIDPAGHVVVGGTRASRWVVLSGRDTIARVTLPDHLIPIPTRIRDSAWTAFLGKLARHPAVVRALKKDLLPATLPAWVSLDVAPTGEWWIGRPGMDGKLASWDVVARGKVVGHLPVPAHYAGPAVIGDNSVAMVQYDDNDVPWIGVYRVVRR